MLLAFKFLTKAKIIASERADPSNYPSKIQKALRFLCVRADGWVFQTPDALKWYESRLGVTEKMVIPNAINSSFLGLPEVKDKEKIIITSGRLKKQKRHDILISAFSKVADKFGDYKLVILGVGPLRNQLEKQIKDLHLDNRVLLPGYVDDVKERLASASLFVLSSDFEGMPNALIEAMSLGLPCISTDCDGGGSRYLIQNEENGLLIPKGDESAMVKAIDRILTDKAFASKISHNAAKIKDELNPEKIYGNWLQFIDKVVQSKIAFVTDTMHPGGSERVISVLANEMARRGMNIQVICLRGKESFYTLDSRINTVFMEQVLNRKTVFNKVRFLRSYVKKAGIDIVIPFMTPVFCFTLFSLQGSGKTIICSERIDPTKTSKVRKFLRAVLLPTTSYLVVQTEQIKKYYAASIQKRCSVIYNPVSDSFFEDNQITPQKRFISVGRLAPQKNQRMLIDAFSMVNQKHPDYKLSIFGDGPLKDELQSYIVSKGLSDAVSLEGTSSDISKELQSSFAFCLTSNFEGMSNAMIEALCTGLPLITTNVSGANELLGNNEGGLIVPVRDTEAFGAAMLKLIESPALVGQMRSYNLKKREAFRTSQIVDKWIEIINRFSDE